jgi:hypothetical protein
MEKILAVEREKLQLASTVELLLRQLQLQQTQTDERSKLQQQFAREKINVQTAMMKCALSSEPAESALRVLYALPATCCITAVDREEANCKETAVLLVYGGQIDIKVHELNHNVAVWFRKTFCFTPKDPVQKARCTLLHPYDAARARELVVVVSHLNTCPARGYPNFMSSTELDEYTVNGKYYIA